MTDITLQNVTLTRNVITFDPKCNNLFDANCNNFSKKNVTTSLKRNVTTLTVTTHFDILLLVELSQALARIIL